MLPMIHQLLHVLRQIFANVWRRRRSVGSSAPPYNIFMAAALSDIGFAAAFSWSPADQPQRCAIIETTIKQKLVHNEIFVILGVFSGLYFLLSIISECLNTYRAALYFLKTIPVPPSGHNIT